MVISKNKKVKKIAKKIVKKAKPTKKKILKLKPLSLTISDNVKLKLNMKEVEKINSILKNGDTSKHINKKEEKLIQNFKDSTADTVENDEINKDNLSVSDSEKKIKINEAVESESESDKDKDSETSSDEESESDEDKESKSESDRDKDSETSSDEDKESKLELELESESNEDKDKDIESDLKDLSIEELENELKELEKEEDLEKKLEESEELNKVLLSKSKESDSEKSIELLADEKLKKDDEFDEIISSQTVEVDGEIVSLDTKEAPLEILSPEMKLTDEQLKIIDDKLKENLASEGVSTYEFYDKYLDDLDPEFKEAFKKPIGLFDPFGDNINPLTGKMHENHYKMERNVADAEADPLHRINIGKSYRNFAYKWSSQNIYTKLLGKIIQTVRDSQVTLLVAGTGTGKTLISPSAILQAFNFQKKVICTVPKKMLAKLNAITASQLLDVEFGKEVGYFCRGENKISNDTKLAFTTSGTLKASVTTGDQLLPEYDCVIIDEVHERSVETDQLLLLMKNILEQRPEFKLVLISATVDPSIYRNYYTPQFTFELLEIPDAVMPFPIEEFYEENPVNSKEIVQKSAEVVANIINTTPADSGDILVFVDNVQNTKSVCTKLDQTLKENNNTIFCQQLDANTPAEDQVLATDESKYKELSDLYNRKVVSSTNVAESSLTITNLKYVVDTGKEVSASYEPLTDCAELKQQNISKASAKQRRGRVGRTSSGVCYRLYTKDEFDNFEDYPKPQIQKTDLTNHVLDIMLLDYVPDVSALRDLLNKLISPPPDAFINSAIKKLELQGAIVNGKLTEMGERLAKFRGLELTFAKSLLTSYKLNCLHEVAVIIAIIDSCNGRMDRLFQEFRPPKGNKLTEDEENRLEIEHLKKQMKFHDSKGDHFTILNVYNIISKLDLEERFAFCKENAIAPHVFVRKDIKLSKNMDKPVYKDQLSFKVGQYKRTVFDMSIDIINEPDPDKMMDESLDNRILYSLAFGHVTNIAYNIPFKKGIYKTCAPIKQSFGKIDKASTLKGSVNAVIYNELAFRGNMYWFGIVSSISVKIYDLLSKELPVLKDCKK